MSGSTTTTSSAGIEPMAGTVPDLDGKLAYLINERGDRRQGEAKRRQIVHVTTQEALAQELSVDNGTITRWRQAGRIPKLSFYTPLIVQIFDCDGHSFRNDDLNTFKRNCEADRITWARLVHGATVALEAIKPVKDGEPAWRARKAGLDGDPLVDRDNLPIVAPGQCFRVEFESPQTDGGAAAWAGWHVLMFNGDSEGYLNWVPRHRATPEFKDAVRFPTSLTSIVVPGLGGRALKVGRQAWGEHDVVLVVSRDRIPPELEGALEQPLLNAVLEPILDQLAGWLAGRMAKEMPEAAMVRAPFFVEQPRAAPPADA